MVCSNYKRANIEHQILIDDTIYYNSASSTDVSSRPGQSTKNNVNTTLISYTAALQKNSNQSDEGRTHPQLDTKSDTSKYPTI